MTRTETILPPHVVLAPSGIFAIQRDIYSLEPTSGAVQHHYPVQGLPELASTPEVLYLNVTNSFKATVQAIPAFQRPILFKALAVAGDIVYLAPSANPPLQPSLFALQATTGQVLWQVPLPVINHTRANHLR